MSRQSDKINMLNQAVTDLQAQIIAKDKQIAFLQGQVHTFQWLMKNSMDSYVDLGDVDWGDIDLGEEGEGEGEDT